MTKLTKLHQSGMFDRRQFIQVGAGSAMLVTGLMPHIAHAAGGLVALVHTQAAGDAGPVDSMIAKLKQLSEEQGFQYRAIYAQDPATYEITFRTLGDAGAAIVVATFNEVAEPFKVTAPNYPDTKWIQLFADPMEPPIGNVITVSYDYYLGCYLSGIFGAHVSRSNKLGFIGGISIPPLNADFNAFKAGVHSVKPEAEVSVAFAGSFQDPAKGQEIANQMFSGGIDYIQTDAAATDFGIIAAANEAEGRIVSVLDPAQFGLGPTSIISIVGLDFGSSLYNEASRAMTNEWAGGSHTSTGLGTGVIDFILNPLFQEQGSKEINAMAESAWLDVQAARAGILDGSITVPFNTEL